MKRTFQNAIAAFSLVELFIVVAVLAVLLFAIVLGVINSRRSSRLNCTNNLKQIGLAFKTFAIDNNDQFPFEISTNMGGTKELIETGKAWPHFSVMSNELSTPKILACPNDKQRVVANTFAGSAWAPGAGAPSIPFTNESQLSYFVGGDARDSRPVTVLAGDACIGQGKTRFKGYCAVSTYTNLSWVKSWHQKDRGNLLLSDGSVTQAASKDLVALFTKSALATNRLVVP